MSINDEIREQQSKLKGQGFKAKWEYFWEYYKVHTIVVIIAIIFIVTLVHDISNKKPYALYAIFVNNQSQDTQEYLQNGFAEFAGLDTEAETCLVDTASNYISSSLDSTAVATSEKILALISASELDVMVSDESTMAHYASQETFLDLRTVFSKEELDALSDKLFYVDQSYIDYLSSDEYTDYITSGKYDETNKYACIAAEYNETYTYEHFDVEDMENPVPVGVYLKDSTVIADCGAYPDGNAIVSIVINTQRTDRALSFIEYLLQ